MFVMTEHKLYPLCGAEIVDTEQIDSVYLLNMFKTGLVDLRVLFVYRKFNSVFVDIYRLRDELHPGQLDGGNALLRVNKFSVMEVNLSTFTFRCTHNYFYLSDSYYMTMSKANYSLESVHIICCDSSNKVFIYSIEAQEFLESTSLITQISYSKMILFEGVVDSSFCYNHFIFLRLRESNAFVYVDRYNTPNLIQISNRTKRYVSCSGSNSNATATETVDSHLNVKRILDFSVWNFERRNKDILANYKQNENVVLVLLMELELHRTNNKEVRSHCLGKFNLKTETFSDLLMIENSKPDKLLFGPYENGPLILIENFGRVIMYDITFMNRISVVDIGYRLPGFSPPYDFLVDSK